MKKLIIILFGIVSLVGFTFALTETEEITIDRVITRWHARQPEDKLVWRLTTLINRINDIQARARLTQKSAEVLNYIEARLLRILNAATGTWTITIIPNHIVYNNNFLNTVTIPTQRETKPLLTLWWTAKPIAKLEYAVSTESMIIETVNIYSSTNQLPKYTEQVALYDELWNFLTSSYVTSDIITFDNLSLEKKPWSHQFYVYLLPSNNNSQTPYTPLTFTIPSFWLIAKGAITWTKINKTAMIQNNLISTVTISSVALETVQFVNSWDGYTINTNLTDWINVLWLLAITTPPNNSIYNRDIILDQITVTVNDATTARNVASLLQIERLDNWSSTSIYGTVNGNTVTFSLNSHNILSTLQQWQNALYRFVADLQLDPSIRESIELMLPNLKSWWITYHSKDSNTLITTIQQRDRITSSARIVD